MKKSNVNFSLGQLNQLVTHMRRSFARWLIIISPPRLKVTIKPYTFRLTKYFTNKPFRTWPVWNFSRSLQSDYTQITHWRQLSKTTEMAKRRSELDWFHKESRSRRMIQDLLPSKSNPFNSAVIIFVLIVLHHVIHLINNLVTNLLLHLPMPISPILLIPTYRSDKTCMSSFQKSKLV